MRVYTLLSNHTHKHDHNCTGDTCTHPSHTHTQTEKKNTTTHKHHNHQHEHKTSFFGTFKKILAPRNLLLTIGTLGLSQLFTYVLSKVSNTPIYNQQHEHKHNNLLTFDYLKEILIFLAQFVFSMASWTVLHNVISHNFKLSKPKTWLEKSNINNILKKSSKDLWDLRKFIGIVSLSYVGIQGLTDYAQSQLPDNKSNLSTFINVLSFTAKAVSIFVTDALLNKKPLSIIAFWQSLADSCACCGNIKLFCPQIAPVFVDLYNNSTFGSNGLTSKPNL